MGKIDYSLYPLYIIVGSLVAITGGFGYYRMTEDRDITVKRFNQMQWAKSASPKLVDRKTSISYFDQILSGNYLRNNNTKLN